MLKHNTIYVWENQITNNCSICSKWGILCSASGHEDSCWEIWKIWSNTYKDVVKAKKPKLWILPQRMPAWSMATVPHNSPSVQPHQAMLTTCMMVKDRFFCLNYELMLYSAGHKQNYFLWQYECNSYENIVIFILFFFGKVSSPYLESKALYYHCFKLTLRCLRKLLMSHEILSQDGNNINGTA